jgi:hypothetical protein
MKCLVTNEAIRAYMHVADQIIELGIDAILAGGFNVTGLEGVVQTMFIPI